MIAQSEINYYDYCYKSAGQGQNPPNTAVDNEWDMDMQYLVSSYTRFETSHIRIITTKVTRNTRRRCSSTCFFTFVCVYVVLRLNLLTPAEIITDSSDLLELSCLGSRPRNCLVFTQCSPDNRTSRHHGTVMQLHA